MKRWDRAWESVERGYFTGLVSSHRWIEGRKHRQTDGWMDRRQTKATNTIKYIQISISEEGSIDTHGKSHGTNWSFAQL